MKQKYRKQKRTASGRKIRPAAVLFLIGLTLTGIFLGKNKTRQGYEQTGAKSSLESQSAVDSQSTLAGEDYWIVRESLAGREEIPLEEYLVGAVGAVCPGKWDAETCKAMAVLIRTNMRQLAEKQGSRTIFYKETGQEMLEGEELYEKWGADYEREYEKIKAAVEDTKGQYFYYEGIPVEFPYFEISAGETRKADEVWGDGTFPYLQTISCKGDIFAEDYMQEMTIKPGKLKEKLRQIFETEEEVSWEDICFEKDKGGYITEAKWNQKIVSGETFRKKLELASANFSVKKQGRGFVFVTKGVGHGFGMSLSMANEMAKEGSNYREILCYFFPDCEIVKS